jgi:hypothetical protein
MKKSMVAVKIANAAGYGLGRNGKNCYYLINSRGETKQFTSIKAAVDFAAANPDR